MTKALQGWWHGPREQWLRRALFQLHLWVGLSIGLYLFAMGITGSLLVFEEELDELFHPQIFHVSGPREPALPISQLLTAAQAQYPDRQATAIYGPTAARETYVVYLRRGDEILHAFVHPATGVIVGTTLPSTSFVRWIQDFHFNLFSGRGGRTVNSLGGLLLFLLCLTGLLLWWPGVRHWPAALRVSFRRTWKRVNWDLHSAAGFWTLSFLTIWGLTGFYFGYAAEVSAFVHRLSPLSQTEAPSSRAAAGPRFPDLDQILADAHTRAPRYPFYGLQMPLNKRGAYTVFLAREWPAEKRDCDYLYFDQYSGQYLKTWHRGVNASWGDTVISAMVPLHFGTFGGTFVRAAWSLLGLSPALMFLTGFFMWWNRVLAKRYRALTDRPGAALPQTVD